MLGLKEGCDLPAKFGNSIPDDVPDQVVVHAEVVVNEAVTHPRHGTPFELGMGVCEAGGDLFRSLADDLHAMHTCPLNSRVGSEPVERQRRTALEQEFRLDQIELRTQGFEAGTEPVESWGEAKRRIERDVLGR